MRVGPPAKWLRRRPPSAPLPPPAPRARLSRARPRGGGGGGVQRCGGRERRGRREHDVEVSEDLLAREIGCAEVIRGHQRSSEVIRGHQRSSEVIRGHERTCSRGSPKLPAPRDEWPRNACANEYLRRELNQPQSAAISRTQPHLAALGRTRAQFWPSEGSTYRLNGAMGGSSEVIRGHQRSSEAIVPFERSDGRVDGEVREQRRSPSRMQP
jgi:hypothetical protein